MILRQENLRRLLASEPDGLAEILELGRFRIVSERRELMVDGTPVSLGRRAFDVARLLVEAEGSVVTKDEIISRVWNGTIVEENSIQVAVSALRKALGNRRELVRTVSGRGYQLLAEMPCPSMAGPSNLPELSSDLIGRASELDEIAGLVEKQRLVTLTGAGGIGKTRLGLEIARRLLPGFVDGAWLVDFGALANANLVNHKVAEALGLGIADNAATTIRITTLLGGKRILVLLDNCEHVIDVVADLAETLTRSLPNLQIVATSREPLRVAGESVYRVPTLSVPEDRPSERTAMLKHSSVELFVARVRAAERSFRLDNETLAAIAFICRRLDGMPLAIELAAARAATLGVDELAARLDDQFKMLTGGLRTALPRHRTLMATFDWSYGLLRPDEQIALCSLAILIGPFSLATASNIVAADELSTTTDLLSSLISKSLIVIETRGGRTKYRLLEATRAYALLKLKESGQFDKVARLHAKTCLAVLDQANRNSLNADEPSVANIDRAIGWAFSSPDEMLLGIDLTIAAAPVFMNLSMANEYCRHIDRALASVADRRTIDPRRMMQLHAARGTALVSIVSPGQEVRAAFQRALDIAEQINDADFRLRALWGLCNATFNDGAYEVARDIARRFCGFAAASGDPGVLESGEALLGVSLHLTGRLREGKSRLERLVKAKHPLGHRLDAGIFANRRTVALSVLAAILWHMGLPDQAMQRAEQSLAEALSLDHALSICASVGNSCFIAMYRGDLAEAERLLELVVDRSRKHELEYWKIWCECFEGAICLERGQTKEGIDLLQSGFACLGDKPLDGRFLYLRGHLAEALGRAGNLAEAITIVNAAMELTIKQGQQVVLPMLLRVEGELFRLLGGPTAFARSEALFRQSIELARQQGARARELQAAIGLASLRHSHGDPPDALDVLAAVRSGFTEGFGTADLIAADRLLANEH